MTFVANPLCRVTVVSPHTRMDVALPAHIPLAELQADLLAHAAASPDGEEFVNEGVEAGGWTLARLGEAPLDPDLSCAQLGIADGEELYFRATPETAPATIFDDVVDAVATAAEDRAGGWRARDTRIAGLTLATLATVGAVATALGAPSAGTAALLLIGGLLGVGAAWALDRAFNLPGPAVLMGALGILTGTAGAAMVAAGDRFVTEYGAPQWLAAGCGAVVYAAVAMLAVNRPVPQFHSALVSSIGLVVGSGLCTWFNVDVAAAASAVAGLTLAVIPALPMISYRIAKLPLPDVPTSPEELRGDIEFADGQGDRLLTRSDHADDYLAGALTGCAAIIGAATMLLGVTDTVPAVILAGIFAALMLLKSRNFHTIRLRVPMLAAGFAGPAAIAGAGVAALAPEYRLPLVAGGLALLALILIVHALAAAGRKLSPLWGRTGDIFHILLAVAVIPMTLWVWGLYWWVRTI
ncbi:MAG TPA: type VII secretion integral membrane protein EccD [Candidatus Stackebrandtia excrementipullorum]|nr:type VII secretion integral membrane protein EccD [Candidatus Stackebrandtia excrementipullorum]